MGTQNPSLRVCINQIDYTVILSGPLDNSPLRRSPVIRVYGESSNGQKACVHIHQVYPYFFVEYTGNMDPDSVNGHIARLTLSLNHAIAVSMRRDPQSPESQFVRAILLVKGIHFYGFHASYSPFLKILISDPVFVNRAVTLLRSGTIMKTRFRIYESHISFLLQFLCDFGLYGCGWMDLGKVWKRGNDFEEAGWGSDRDEDATFESSPYVRQSRMPLEVDVAAHQILNRHLLSARNIHHELTIPAPPLPSEPLVLSVRELWEDERRRRTARGLSPSPDIPKDPSENSRGKGGAWVAEASWWDEIRKRIEREREHEEAPDDKRGWKRWVMTTFESIEALWEEEHKTWKPSRSSELDVVNRLGKMEENPYSASQKAQPWSQGHAKSIENVEVDETMLAGQVIEEVVEHEEVGWRVFDGPAPEDDLHEDEQAAAENGPPLEDQGIMELPSTPTKSSSKRSNAFQDAWHKLVGSYVRQRSTSITSTNAPSTPKKRSQTPVIDLITPPTTPSRSTVQIPEAESRSAVTDVFSPIRLGRLANSALSVTSKKSRPESAHLHPVPDSCVFEPKGSHKALSTIANQKPICLGPLRDISIPVYPDSSIVPIAANDTHDTFIPSIDMHDPSGQRKKRHVRSATPPGYEGLEETDRSIKRAKIHHDANSPSPSSSAHVLSGVKSISQLSNPFTQETMTVNPSRVNGYLYAQHPPTTAELLGALDDLGIPSRIYVNPHYSKDSDAPERPREYAGLVFHLKGGNGLSVLDEWDSGILDHPQHKLNPAGVYGWEYAGHPPSVCQARQWLKTHPIVRATRRKPASQIEGPTQANPYGLKTSPAQASKTSIRERHNMGIFALEVFAPSRETRLPDPVEDKISAVFYTFRDSADFDEAGFQCNKSMIVVESRQLNTQRLRGFNMEVVTDELELINRVIDVVVDRDPDIVVGWEVQNASWGYLSARANTYGLDLGEQISRAPGYKFGVGSEEWGMRTASTFKVTGRHVLNLWRIMRAEQNLTSYTLENVAFHVLRRRVPYYSAKSLTEWYHSPVPGHIAQLLRYFTSRTSMSLEILDVAEVVTKNAEFARIFGVDFFSVLSRGSQFKVESFMFRIAKPESFVLLSPSKEDVGKQNAAECMPLIMEPLSAFYNSPLVVLDFQSLYPSVMIAYNYCYSTCLGRVTEFKGQNKFGVTELHQPAGLLEKLQEHIHVAPNGLMYVKQNVRRGLLGRMLTDLLDTRVMVKQAMKGVKDDSALTRILNARQLGLKYIANVTYGYTSATFSGRMPAVEIADSIVQSGRETLEKAIRVINGTKKWGAKVVYGDTDSLFIYLPGRTKEQAFRIGHDMADTITAMNPAPVKLKFEKVYLPCVLMAKKRYVGFKFESPDDREPVFDAKGIETVRRDGVPAQQKMTETCLKILFRTQDLSQVKDYCCRSWSKILENKVSIQDFIFAKEVKMGTYSDKVPPPPGVIVAARRMVEDPNDEPQYGERVTYVIARGEPDSRLVDRAVAPEELLNNSHKHLDAAYYLSRVLIPPLERIFNLVGADVRAWYDEMPKALRADQPDAVFMSPKKAKRAVAAPNAFKIDEHFVPSHCLNCGASATTGLCDECREDPQATISGLLLRMRKTEGRLRDVQAICSSCCGTPAAEPIKCDSLDCPWLFERRKAEHKTEALELVQELIGELELAEEVDVEVEAEAEDGRQVVDLTTIVDSP